jgi:hypothetical protein
LESLLKSSCEKLIAQQTQALLGPLLAFFTRMGAEPSDSTRDPVQFKRELVSIVSAMVGQSPPSVGGTLGAAVDQSAPLSSSPFATHLRALLRHTHLYLQHAPTERSLLQPIQRSLTEVFQQLSFFVQTHFPREEGTAASVATTHSNPSADEALTLFLQQSIRKLEENVTEAFRE